MEKHRARKEHERGRKREGRGSRGTDRLREREGELERALGSLG